MNDDIKTYVKLKYFPIEGTKEYLDNLPLGISYKLYNRIFHYGAAGAHLYTVLRSVLLNPEWNERVSIMLEELLVEHYKSIAASENKM